MIAAPSQVRFRRLRLPRPAMETRPLAQRLRRRGFQPVSEVNIGIPVEIIS
jgi:hypothetical protein